MIQNLTSGYFCHFEDFTMRKMSTPREFIAFFFENLGQIKGAIIFARTAIYGSIGVRLNYIKTLTEYKLVKTKANPTVDKLIKVFKCDK